MSLGAAQIVAGTSGWQISRLPGPDLSALVKGRALIDTAALLPRLFNLCRTAQASAARLALGLSPASDEAAEILQEIRREHLARIFVTLRQAFGLQPMAPPRPAGPGEVFGAAQALPATLPDFEIWVQQPLPAAELARQIMHDFPPPLGVASVLPPPPAAHCEGAFENAPALRQAGHPLLQQIEKTQGRGPLWRYLGLLADFQAALGSGFPGPCLLSDGTAVVQAARGSYALRIQHQDGRVISLWRQTPTDHQLASGGALEQALSSIPTHRADLARRLVALHDPCIPVTLPEAQDA